MGIFKIYKHPVTGVVLTDVNTKYVCSVNGVDTNPGTRALPFATITKAQSSLSGATNIVLRGFTTENCNISSSIIGDGEDAYINGICVGNYEANLYNLTIKKISGNYGSVRYCYVKEKGSGSSSWSKFNFIESYCEGTYYGYGDINSTILYFKNYIVGGQPHLIYNSGIIVNVIDLYPSQLQYTSYPKFEYCLFRKATLWKWNNVLIPGTTNSTSINEILTALSDYATNVLAGSQQAYLRLIIANSFYVDTILGQTNKIVDDSITPIFNRYSDGIPTDFSLNLNGANTALFMSDALTSETFIQNYVGCYRANVGGMIFDSIVHVDEFGNDTNEIPDMLVKNADNTFYASQNSIQFRNRIRTTIPLEFTRGFSFLGMQSNLVSGVNNRFYFGKVQPFTSTDIPQESVEVIPYDNLIEISAFPRFSATFNGACKMWYFISGAKNNQPVLFNDLLVDCAIVTNKSLTEYGDWAVTNADFETLALNSLPALVALRNVNVKFFKLELNLNYAS